MSWEEGREGRREGGEESEREGERENLISPILSQQLAHTLTTYSKTKVRLLAVWIMSCRVTIFACLSPFSSDAKV